MLVFALLIVVPVALSGINYLFADRRGNWQTADRSSAGLLPGASEHPDAVIRVYAARTVRWRGIFAVHCWIVVKERGAPRYTRYDYTAWGEPIRVDGFAPDGRWFGAVPETVVSVDGDKAERLIPKIRSVVETYRFAPMAITALGRVRTRTPLSRLPSMRFLNSRPCCRRRRSARIIPTAARGSALRRPAPACLRRSAAIWV
jgi:hypothetical protein